MFDSLRGRWLLASGLAVVAALTVTALFSSANRSAKGRGDDAAAVWKARTGVDLVALPRLHPAQPDSAAAQGLDLLLEPLGLNLGGKSPDRRPPPKSPGDSEPLDALRDALRAAIRSKTTEPPEFPQDVVSLLERRATTLDAVADYVAAHRDIHWREDFGPRPHSSALYTGDHLTIHRLLIGRAFLALERQDTTTATRMMAASQQLNRSLLEREELDSQLIAAGVERLQLALMRRAGSTLGTTVNQPTAGIRERYLDGMSAEATLILTNVREREVINSEDDVAERVIEALAAPKIELAASEAVKLAALGVQEIGQSQDGCLELAKERRTPDGFFSGNFYTLNPTEVWRRFVVLSLDRAMTAAVLTGSTSSPCPSVVIAVREEGSKRTVELKGLPADSDSVIALPATVTTHVKP